MMKDLTKWIGAVSAVVMFTSCEMENTGLGNAMEKSAIEFRLTDSPGDYEEVNVEILQVSVRQASGGWVELETNPGIYNLLDYTNGHDTLLAFGDLTAAPITEIRFRLGGQNSVTIDSTAHVLEAPSGEGSGLKVKFHKDIQPGIEYKFIADWNVGEGVVQQGNGTYLLKPVIRFYAEAHSGAIIGNVNPDAVSYVYAVEQELGDTIGTYTGNTGEFMLRGVQEGTYTLYIDGGSAFNLYALKNVSVTTGNVTSVGEVDLQMFWE